MAGTVNQTGALLVDGEAPHGPPGRGQSGQRPPGPPLARWLWPPRCLVCRGRGARGLDLCQACADALPWLGAGCIRCAIPLPGATPGPATVCGACLQHPPPLAETHAACLYGAPLDRLLPRFKFHHDLAVGRLLAQLMAHAFASLPDGWPQPAAVLPIPLHPRRLRQRGYDQALELARPLARALQLPLLTGALARARDTAPQSRLQATQRQRNLKDAFRIDQGTALPAHVVLVDDVMTTGATLHAAADALQRAGVARVDAWICARVP
ncbi:double zinc ribbon domain-containing protein [Lysobacter sp. F6437]|uniref:double zinc ribbon domain-containing protein n=1 Tax=Lysobacter sp. F6437 TaxID=3459296 RepID=UPI00403D6FA1